MADNRGESNSTSRLFPKLDDYFNPPLIRYDGSARRVGRAERRAQETRFVALRRESPHSEVLVVPVLRKESEGRDRLSRSRPSSNP